MKNEEPGKTQRYPTIPSDWNRLAGYSTSCPCGKVHSIDTRQFNIRAGALQDVPQCIASLFRGRSIGMVADERTYSVAGQTVVELLLSAGNDVTGCIVPDGEGGRPHATFDAVLDLERHLAVAVDAETGIGNSHHFTASGMSGNSGCTRAYGCASSTRFFVRPGNTGKIHCIGFCLGFGSA